MGRTSRRMRRAMQRGMPEPTMREVAPGVYDLALPIPPGMPPDEARALAERFADELRAKHGVTLGSMHVCTPGTCTHQDEHSK